MTHDEEPAIIVELIACPGLVPQAQGPVAEMPYRVDAWSPDEVRTLRRMFLDDAGIDEIAQALDRGRAGVADRIHVLGLRRHTTRPWSPMEDADLTRIYGSVATATIAAGLGRTCSAVYARAGALALTEGNSPPWTAWEDAQLREGYARALPLAELAALVGRPLSGLASRAGSLGLRHPDKPVDWSDAEMGRAVELAAEGHRYLAIIEMMVAEGFPRRTKAGFGPMIRKLGYARGWGRAWIAEEDAMLVAAYASGGSLTPLRTRLGRTVCSIRWRAEHLGLRGTHEKRNGWRTSPDWTDADLARLRAEYGRTPTPELARRMGRTRASLTTRANIMGLVHGYQRPWSDDDRRALALAFAHGLAIADAAAVLGRNYAAVHKYAEKHGLRFGRRPRRDPLPTKADILALDDPEAMERRGEGEGDCGD